MLDYNQALAIALKEVVQCQRDVSITILEEDTIDIGVGWVFFYQSVDYVKTGDYCHQLAGNAPLIVSKKTGEIAYTGTALSVEDYIEEYLKAHVSDG